VDAGATFVPHVKAAKLMEPRQRALDDPARPAEATPMRGPALRQLRLDAAAVEGVAVRLRIIAAVALHESRLPQRSTGAPAQCRNAIDERQQLGHVVAVRRREARDNRNPVGVGKNMMFRPGLTAIGRVRSSFFPPRNARSEALSTTARARSSWPRRRNSVSKTRWSRFHTPARCHRTSRRQQVLPDPQPISFGSICQGRPLRNTNRIPVKAARSGTRGRPIALNRRRGGFGNRGSIRLHKASSIRRWARCDRLAAGHVTVPSSPPKYKSHVSYF
jgi:hypothetical protein